VAHIAAMSGATAAAAAAARKLREEEENLTTYTPEDLAGDWEFKIVRSTGTPFHRPETLQRLVEEEAAAGWVLVEEEAAAGWVLVEKFDDSRVRFKRPSSARERDYLLPPEVDPYRTQYGVSEGTVGMVVVGVMVLVIAAVLLVVLLIAPQ
jgi:hypothetical protein